MTNAQHTPDFTLKETAGANGFNYWIKGVGNLYPDDKCTDEKLALIAAAPELLEMLQTVQIWADTTKHPLNVMDKRMFDNVRAAIAKATGK